MCLFRRKLNKTELYVVKETFTIVEWGDAYGDTECRKTIPVGARVQVESYRNGRIKKITVNGVSFGTYNLVTRKSDILSHCLRVS